jgi:hypothetical protein
VTIIEMIARQTWHHRAAPTIARQIGATNVMHSHSGSGGDLAAEEEEGVMIRA